MFFFSINKDLSLVNTSSSPRTCFALSKFSKHRVAGDSTSVSSSRNPDVSLFAPKLRLWDKVKVLWKGIWEISHPWVSNDPVRSISFVVPVATNHHCVIAIVLWTQVIQINSATIRQHLVLDINRHDDWALGGNHPHQLVFVALQIHLGDLLNGLLLQPFGVVFYATSLLLVLVNVVVYRNSVLFGEREGVRWPPSVTRSVLQVAIDQHLLRQMNLRPSDSVRCGF